jgi:hypothetical protein
VHLALQPIACCISAESQIGLWKAAAPATVLPSLDQLWPAGGYWRGTCGVFSGVRFPLIVRCRPSWIIVARAKLRKYLMKQMLMNRIAVICVLTASLTLPLLFVGCAHEISHTERSRVSSDGTVKSQEKTVTQSSDGTVTTTEESKRTSR